MKIRARLLSAAVAGALTVAVGVPATHALSESEIKCQENIAKSGRKFFKKKLKTVQKCTEKNLKSPGDCSPGELAEKVAKIEAKLDADLDKKCIELVPFNFASIGFPGKCTDPDPSNGFTLADLKPCIRDSHEAVVDEMVALEYGDTTGPILDKDLFKCQKEVAKSGGKFADGRLKTVQKCRNSINKGKLFGFLPRNCATAHPKTAEKVQKFYDRSHLKILAKCTDEQIQQLDVCDPPATTALEAADCTLQAHGDLVDNPDLAAPADLIDYQYATQPQCGDGIVNQVSEECDGDDVSSCAVGPCGAGNSNFPCLCLDKKRQRVIEHSGSDLDNGWTGQAHDQDVNEGGGYLIDLYDCDNVSDFDCLIGPSCSLAPHSPCAPPKDSQGTTGNAICAALGQGTCRKERTAVGPHCNLDIQVACTSNAQCPGVGNFCVKQFHGPPLPLAAGAVSVCVVNEFTEDIVGTTNLATGAGSIRLRQNSKTHLEGNIPQPCPVCGGWCNDSGRANCQSDANCNPGVKCVTEPICSRGPNANKECRPDPPFGGVAPLFGNTSLDCPPLPPNLIATIDILFNPATTGTTTRIPEFPCNHESYLSKTCRNGSNSGAVCTTDSQCPGGVCSEQCFCPSIGGTQQAPNQCADACVGGTADAFPCNADSECPGGFCHRGDCRDAGLSGLQANEGVCTSGPADQKCSQHTFRGCTSDVNCRPPSAGGDCPFCLPTETCVTKQRECFVNTGLVRTGLAHPTDPVGVSTFCITATSNGATNSTAGLPGPGALRNVQTKVKTGF